LTDFVCLYTYEFLLSLWKIVRSSVILLLPLSTRFFVTAALFHTRNRTKVQPLGFYNIILFPVHSKSTCRQITNLQN
jgi:hypothetical protein